MKQVLATFIVLFLFILAYFVAIEKQGPYKNSISNIFDKIVPSKTEVNTQDREVVVQDLDIPWEVAFLPNNEFLITERPGRLLRIGKDKKVIEIQGVQHVGEGGLMGLALHPDFEKNQLLYLYFTTGERGRLTNQLERYKLVENSLSEKKVILSGVLGSSNHDGGRIMFGPDGLLYIGTGDAEQSNLAQDTKSLNGKILRIKDDGSIPKDNPFGNAVYSYGHRNVQGLAWDDKGNLWATEHGQSDLDELNLIEKGKNYGWPVIQGDEKRSGMVTPIVNSGANETWAPAGAVFLGRSIYFVGLKGETLYEARIEGLGANNVRKHLVGVYGRLRAIRIGPDGAFYITTSNTDGRGIVRGNDDKLIRINPKKLP